MSDLHSQPKRRADPGADQGKQVLVSTLTDWAASVFNRNDETLCKLNVFSCAIHSDLSLNSAVLHSCAQLF